MKKFLGAIAFFSAVALVPSGSSALSLNATNHNQEFYTGTPAGIHTAAALHDGDFTIIDHDLTSTSTIGDGINDRTSWVFNFQYDPNYVPLLSTPLLSAYLTLWLTPKDSLVTNDGVSLDGLPIIRGFTANTTIFQIELLGTYYSSSQIEEIYNNNFGIITAQYADDSYVSYANLHLTTAPVPEPATILLLGLGIAGLAGSRIKRKGKGKRVQRPF